MYLQNRTDSRLSLCASLFGDDFVKKMPFIESGASIEVDSITIKNVFETNATWKFWLDKDFVRIIDNNKKADELVDTITLDVPSDLEKPEPAENIKIETTLKDLSKPKSVRK